MARRAHFTELQIAEAIRKTAGVIAAAARVLEATHGRSCTREQLRGRVARSARLQALLHQVLEQNIDLAEGQLLKAINNSEGWAVQFMLKTKGKGRGWTEKIEVGGRIEHAVTHHKDIDEMSMDELDDYLAEQATGPVRH